MEIKGWGEPLPEKKPVRTITTALRYAAGRPLPTKKAKRDKQGVPPSLETRPIDVSFLAILRSNLCERTEDCPEDGMLSCEVCLLHPNTDINLFKEWYKEHSYLINLTE